jgi:hypothetical protein
MLMSSSLSLFVCAVSLLPVGIAETPAAEPGPIVSSQPGVSYRSLLVLPADVATGRASPPGVPPAEGPCVQSKKPARTVQSPILPASGRTEGGQRLAARPQPQRPTVPPVALSALCRSIVLCRFLL